MPLEDWIGFLTDLTLKKTDDFGRVALFLIQTCYYNSYISKNNATFCILFKDKAD